MNRLQIRKPIPMLVKSALLLLPAAMICWQAAQAAAPPDLPVVDGKKVVATVGGDPIFWAEFERALALSHVEALNDPKRKMEGDATTGGIDFDDILQRLVDVRLILREAANMGLDALPEVEEALEAHRRETLGKMVLERHVKDVTAGEEKIQEAYLELARQWKLRSALFKRKEKAEEVADRLAQGADFEEQVKAAVAADLASVDDEGRYLKRSDLSSAMAEALVDMEIGQVSPVIPLGLKGFALFQLQGIREPEAVDPKQWEAARKQVHSEMRAEAAEQYYQRLKKRYAKVDEALLEALDY